MQASMQPRKHFRYRLEIPVSFFWKVALDTQHEGTGITRDMSVRGAFVYTTSPPPMESAIEIKAFLPSGRGAVPMARIYGRSRVLRVEAAHDGESRAGFAVAGERFTLRRGEEDR